MFAERSYQPAIHGRRARFSAQGYHTANLRIICLGAIREPRVKGNQLMPSGSGAPLEGRMAEPTDEPTDEHADPARRREEDALLRQAELIISVVLRGGVLLAAAIIALGALLFYTRYLAAGGRIGHLTYPHTVAGVFAGLAHGDPVAVITLGLLVLLLTPVLRVLVSVITFAMERDWPYTGITLLVFIILLISFLLGRGGA